jgi:hypothetical protein
VANHMTKSLVMVLACVTAPVQSVAQVPVAIQPSARLSIGEAAGDTLEEFDRVVTPFLMPDGRLVVPLNSASTIRVFSADGKFLNSLGRKGSGPGEFLELHSVWSRGDTIEALDSRLHRITRFLPNGSVQTVMLRSGMHDLAAVSGPAGADWLVGGVASSGYGRRDTVAVRRFARDGSDRGVVGVTAGFARYQSTEMSGPEPLSPRPVLQAHGGRLYLADNMAASIRVVQPNGTVERTITWTPPRAISARDAMRMVIDSAVARAPADRALSVRRRWEDAPVRDRMPAFSTFLVDDLGYIWVRPYDPFKHSTALNGLVLPGGGPGGRWSVLSPAGVRVAEIDLPADLAPICITNDAVVGIAHDEFGVESVRVHVLQRRRN